MEGGGQLKDRDWIDSYPKQTNSRNNCDLLYKGFVNKFLRTLIHDKNYLDYILWCSKIKLNIRDQLLNSIESTPFIISKKYKTASKYNEMLK